MYYVRLRGDNPTPSQAGAVWSSLQAHTYIKIKDTYNFMADLLSHLIYIISWQLIKNQCIEILPNFAEI